MKDCFKRSNQPNRLNIYGNKAIFSLYDDSNLKVLIAVLISLKWLSQKQKKIK
jgi:hypothetical protein